MPSSMTTSLCTPSHNASESNLCVNHHALSHTPLLRNLQMLRYRVTMSVCTLFCIFGVIQLLTNAALRRTARRATDLARCGRPAELVCNGVKTCSLQGTEVLRINCSPSQGSCQDEVNGLRELGELPLPKRQQCSVLPLVLLALWLRAACLVLSRTLWPLWVRLHFGLGAAGYSRLLLASSLIDAAGVAYFPHFERRCGRLRCLWLLSGGVAVGSWAFAMGGASAVWLKSSSLVRPLHLRADECWCSG